MEDTWSSTSILSWNFSYFFSGGWHGRGTFKVTFSSGGAIEFAEHFRVAVASGELINYTGFQ